MRQPGSHHRVSLLHLRPPVLLSQKGGPSSRPRSITGKAWLSLPVGGSLWGAGGAGSGPDTPMEPQGRAPRSQGFLGTRVI